MISKEQKDLVLPESQIVNLKPIANPPVEVEFDHEAFKMAIPEVKIPEVPQQ